ncbi:mevalonate kinase [Marinilabilia salmonicolor]|jgi:mevalonate kinase|uniref:GYDIA family GHMP kinase n=1 Tax=Marinilabilia salmonicolor TaxID=989 RepID=UPI000D049BC1|nr:GYDIA family GHMP kinase [Marinilabilia salmonicolor]PRZ00244.1 mevalonate kinase [Marinilabilia salmonicolor]
MQQESNRNSLKFHANGKLLLSGEYVVLYGAKALAVPLKYGQSMEINEHSGADFTWKATHPKGDWFEARFTPQLKLLSTNDKAKALKLKEILSEAGKQAKNPVGFSGITVNTHLQFAPEWGWGSSSTLISNISRWMDVDPYKLLEKTFGGSGYDIACATNHSPLFYSVTNENPKAETTIFSPPFADKFWVVYLNRKQSSADSIRKHTQSGPINPSLIQRISEITELMTSERSENNFIKLMKEHELLIGKFTGMEPVQSRIFHNFPGQVKSLGAWGGDFILALSQTSPTETKKYFQTKGFHVLFNLSDIILDTNHAT